MDRKYLIHRTSNLQTIITTFVIYNLMLMITNFQKNRIIDILSAKTLYYPVTLKDF